MFSAIDTFQSRVAAQGGSKGNESTATGEGDQSIEAQAVHCMAEDASVANAAWALGALRVRAPRTRASIVAAAMESQAEWVLRRVGAGAGAGAGARMEVSEVSSRRHIVRYQSQSQSQSHEYA